MAEINWDGDEAAIRAELRNLGKPPVVGERMSAQIFGDRKGCFPDGELVLTGEVIAIDYEHNLVQTINSLYRIPSDWPPRQYLLEEHPGINPQPKPHSSREGRPEDVIFDLLVEIGEDPTREGLKDTPARVMKAWKEWASGYLIDPATILKSFHDGSHGYDELIVVHNIPFISKCEHHLADIIGHAHVGYIPNGKIIGLSKLPRLVEVFARRLQVQERATVQIADALMQHLEPRGAGVIVRAAHSCMSTRGVRIHGSMTTTSAMRGVLLTKPEARKEFLDLCTMAERRD